MQNHRTLSNDARVIWRAGVDAVLGRPLVARSVQIDSSGHLPSSELVIEGQRWSREDYDRVVIIGAGKAATAMAQGLIEVIEGWLPYTGWINVPAGTEAEIQGVQVHPARPAGRNEPTIEGIVGTKQILDIVATAGPRDLCIALISGGGSALMPAPIEGISLQDKQVVTRFLSDAGADITELNTVRKHLSQVKGGGLLAACQAKQIITLILSDVLGDPLDLIASGPTVPDRSTSLDAIQILQRFDPEGTLPSSITEALTFPRSRKQTATAISIPIILGNNAVAVDEAGIQAESLGYNHVMQSAITCEGEAESVGRHLAKMTVEMLRANPNQHRTDCLITGGEPVVRLIDPEMRGKGGRNQQLVLAAYCALLDRTLVEQELSENEWSQICFLSGGTDGEDGPTDAAGAWIDSKVHQAARSLGLDPHQYLLRNDAYSFFQQTGGLFDTGPTGTNVCDLRVAVVNRRPL